VNQSARYLWTLGVQLNNCGVVGYHSAVVAE
jgi:hypothetical protein